MNWAPYQGARTCTGTVTPGARALLAWIDEAYEGYSLGIYNCRTVRGGSTTSLHGEGRAYDHGIKQPGPGQANPVGHEILRRLAAHGARLGIQCIIWDRRIYSTASPNGRYYGGVSPHYDHLHIELNWDGARDLTLATLRSVLGGAAPAGPLGSRLLRQGDKGPDVEEWQRILKVAVDGEFGTETHAATVALQQRHGLDADGVVGPTTLRAAGQVQIQSVTPVPTTRSRCMYMAWHKGAVYLFSHDDRGLPVRRGWGMNEDEIAGFKAMGVPLGGEVNEVAYKACRAIWV